MNENKTVLSSGEKFDPETNTWTQIPEMMQVFIFPLNYLLFTFTFNHLADTFIQSDLQMRTIEAIKTNKKQQHASYDKSRLA